MYYVRTTLILRYKHSIKLEDYLIDQIDDLYPPLLQAIDLTGTVVSEQLASIEGWVWEGKNTPHTFPVSFYFTRPAKIASVLINYGEGDCESIHLGDPIQVSDGDIMQIELTVELDEPESSE